MDARKTMHLRAAKTISHQAAYRRGDRFEQSVPLISREDVVAMLSLAAIVGIVVFLALGG